MFKRFILSLCLVSLTVGCGGHRLSQGRSFQLNEVAFDELPDWEEADFKGTLPALRQACRKPAPEWIDFCDDLPTEEKKLKRYIEKNLTPYQVAVRGKTTGKITGYYESELTGSRTHTNGAQVPVYGLPYRYQKDRKIEPRHIIEADADFPAPIVAWADDPVDLFLLHVQGSGRMTTPEGEIRLGYAGNNGHTFRGIGSILADEDLIDEAGHSMPQIREWLQAHPKEARELMAQNPRYIFFKEIQGETPIGTAGVPLTPEHSVAVDKRYIPMQTPMWLVTQKPNGEPLRRLVVAQDTGNAIQGGIRADFFWGHGEEAFQQAGRMNQEGSYYLLLPD